MKGFHAFVHLNSLFHSYYENIFKKSLESGVMCSHNKVYMYKLQ